MMRSLVVVLMALVPVIPARVDAGACARPQIPTQPLTPAGDIAKDGGVVVSMEDAARAPKLVFARGKQDVVAKTTVIGPGLVVYTPPSAGEWSLQAGTKAMVKIKTGADAKPLAAPSVKSIKYNSVSGRRGISVWVLVDVNGAVPAGAVALVVFDDKGKPKSWGRVGQVPPDPSAKTTAVNVFSSGSCTVLPNGTEASLLAQKVQIAWLDSSGRLSAMTKAVVEETPPAKRDPTMIGP
jgi:hypothetical protein